MHLGWTDLLYITCNLSGKLVVHTEKAGIQGSVQNQDAACLAGAMLPLLDIIAAGPDQLAAKSAALAISALATNHTANQDAFRLSLTDSADGVLHLEALQGAEQCCDGGSACEHASMMHATLSDSCQHFLSQGNKSLWTVGHVARSILASSHGKLSQYAVVLR